MYIKFSFREQLAIVPHVWADLVVELTEKPKLVESLTFNTVPFQRTNQIIENDYGNNEDENLNLNSTYDYYYDCGHASKDAILKAMHRFDGPLFENEPITTEAYGFYSADLKNSIVKFFDEHGHCLVYANSSSAYIKHMELSLAHVISSPVQIIQKNDKFKHQLMTLFANRHQHEKEVDVIAAPNFHYGQ